MIIETRADARELTHQRTFTAYGVAIGLRSDDAEVLTRACACLPPNAQESADRTAEVWFTIETETSRTGPRVRYLLSEGGALVAEGYRLSRVLEALDSAIRLQVGGRSPDRLFVHAGVVVWRDRAILVPGRSGTGKTRLVVALVRAGATYYSDEYAVLDSQGMVHDFARPISWRQGEHRRMALTAEGDLGGHSGSVPRPVALVVHTRYRPDAVWSPRVMSAGESALACFGNVLAARQRPAFAFSVLSSATSSAMSWRSDRGEAEGTAVALLQQFDSSSRSLEGANP